MKNKGVQQLYASSQISEAKTCEKSHATYQLGVWWRAMIIPFRTQSLSFFYHEKYKL